MYTARERDKESGLYFYRARYYDARLGRFVSADPIGFAGGNINLYVIVSNNPIVFVDPFGLIDYGQVGLGMLQGLDSLTIAGTAVVAVVGTAIVTENPVLTVIVAVEMVPVVAAAIIEGKHAVHNITEGIKDEEKNPSETVPEEPVPDEPIPGEPTPGGCGS